MKPLNPTLRPGDSGPAIANLQDALDFLDFRIAGTERTDFRFGRQTQQALQAFQKQNTLDQTGELDQPTADRLNQLLNDKNQLSYRVSGRVLNQKGEPLMKQIVQVYDVDLRGAGRYRTAQTVAELQQGGFQELGKAITNPDGVYSVSFNYQQFNASEKGLADVVAFALTDDRIRITGRSRLSTNGDYANGLDLEQWDITLPQTKKRSLSEFNRIEEDVAPLLRSSQLQWHELEATGDQLLFLADETEHNIRRLAVMVQSAKLAREQEWPDPAHELLFGLGRQNIALDWTALAATPADELKAALEKAILENCITPQTEEIIDNFFKLLAPVATKKLLQKPIGKPDGLTLDKTLSFALRTNKEKAAFLDAHRSFTGTPQQFWNEFLPAQAPFRDRPAAIDALKLTNQLATLTGNHLPLVEELQATQGIKAAKDLLKLSDDDWKAAIEKTGLPEGVTDPKVYMGDLKNLLNAAYPTQRIGLMIGQNKLTYADANVATGLTAFFEKADQFDMGVSRVDDFAETLRTTTGDHHNTVRDELLTLQRLYQVSPSPEALSRLKDTGLKSAYEISSIPEQTFINEYGKSLGGANWAKAVHDRATYQTARLEHATVSLHETLYGASPVAARLAVDRTEVEATIANHLPNYQELLGSADLCECQHCQSIYSPSAYFVDVLRLLGRSKVAGRPQTALKILLDRRPDLAHLPLTCENTETLIPYIDLVNEILEYYVVHGQLNPEAAHDIAGATAPELRASPQFTLTEAYRKLATEAIYPTSLPYHQPLDTIRTFLNRWQLSRADLLETFGLAPTDRSRHALTAEQLGLSEPEYGILTNQNFDGAAAGHSPWEYYGFVDENELLTEGVKVLETIHRLNIPYVDLVELVKTRFLNPFQHHVDYLEDIFKGSTLSAVTLYQQFVQIQAGELKSADVPELKAVLEAKRVTTKIFDKWVRANFDQVRSVVTLFEPESKCDLASTRLRTIRSVAEDLPGAGLDAPFFLAMHQFVRLQRKLKYSIHDFDNLLMALGFDRFSPDRLDVLAQIQQLNATLKLPLPQVAVIWGTIDTYGPKSLYAKLFLNKSVQRIDPVFLPDASGNFLSNSAMLLNEHQTTVLAALRLTAEDLGKIAQHTGINLQTAPLSLGNLSVFYRYALLAKTLKLPVSELITLKTVFGIEPFSRWDGGAFIDKQPGKTAEFVQLVMDVKASGFKIPVLNYILTGTANTRTAPALSPDKVLTTLRAIREGLQTIELTYPENDPAALTDDGLRSRLALVFPLEVADQAVGMLNGTIRYSTLTEKNLIIALPADLVQRIRYTKASGRLQVTGVMTNADRDTLKALSGASAEFSRSVDALYAQPETFLQNSFSAIFTSPTDFDAAKRDLLNHPAQPIKPTLLQKQQTFYAQFLPFLKKRLRQNIVIQQVATLIGLDVATTRAVLGSETDALAMLARQAGLSADYFKDAALSVPGVSRLDATVDFQWETGSPDPVIPVDTFSVRWNGFISPETTADYTFVVEVEDADEAVQLWVNDELLVNKSAGDTRLSWEGISKLSIGKFARIRLEYVESVRKAGVRLFWYTDQTPKVIIPASVLYPLTFTDAFTQQTGQFHRAALLINTLKQSVADVQHLISFNAHFDELDFTALTPANYQRLRAFADLRTTFSVNPTTLVSFLSEATRTTPGNLATLLARLSDLTGWDVATITALTTHFGFDVAHFRNEIALAKLQEALRIVWKTGAAVASLGDWAQPVTDFDLLNIQAQAIKNTLKAQLSEEDWQNTAGTLNDKIRENQKHALIDYLLQQPALRTNWGIKDADGLYEYFLIDVQMTAGMDTSRMVQATAAVQQFVSRCFLNLENRLNGAGKQIGIPPETIDTNRWAWMKNYRVWEANRKVFTYPENWLEPEWRDDKTEFFGELESDLLQNDITDRSVEDAFRSYLRKLADVANLKLCGMFQDEKTGILHVFGRNHADPPTYYYRTCDKFGHWGGWSKVPVAIQGTKSDTGNGNNNGVHLVPVVWKNRLLLFWPEFMEKHQENSSASGTTFEGIAGKTPLSLKPTPYWEIRLAWSEFREGKWTSKHVSEEFIRTRPTSNGTLLQPHQCTFITVIDRIKDNKLLEIELYFKDSESPGAGGRFVLTDIEANIEARSGVRRRAYISTRIPNNYDISFMAVWENNPLLLGDAKYLRGKRYYGLLFSHHVLTFETLRKYPFFYYDDQRTYFVKPTDFLKRVNTINRPDSLYYVPLETSKVQVSFQRIPASPINPTSQEDEAVKDVVGNFLNESLTKMPPNHTFSALPTVGSFNPQSRTLNVKTDLMTTDRMIGGAFSGAEFERTDRYNDLLVAGFGTRWDIGLKFRPFYHPFAGAFVSRLNQGGLSGLMEADTQLPDDLGDLFEQTYKPNTDRRLVQKPFPRVNVDFTEYGPYSLYNYELFFHAPLFIATRLSKNGQYADAMRWFHYIFDPTTNEKSDPDNPNARFWKVKPFRTASTDSIEEFFRGLRPNTDGTENQRIVEWRDFPFRPHRIAKGRPSAYLKNVVLKYVENLTSWGDDLFRRETRESITEATQLYVMAAHILGPKPQFVPKRGTIQSETFATLQPKLDDFGNALVQMENLFPFSSGIPAPNTAYNGSMLGVGTALYFGIPHNEKMLKYWDTIGDRLFKIRHCLNIDGVELKLALFEPPIDPALLMAATAKGLSIGSIWSDLRSPSPLYRFMVVLQKANEFVAEVKNLGSGLLSAIEKRDAEELNRRRATHESVLLAMARDIRTRQVLEAKAQKAGLEKSRDTLKKRFKYFTDILGLAETAIPEPIYLPNNINEDTALPADTQIPNVEVDVDVSLVEGEETGVKLIPKEQEELNKMNDAKWLLTGASSLEALSSALHLTPEITVYSASLGIGVTARLGGEKSANAVSGLATVARIYGNHLSTEGNQAGRMASYIRRDQEWTMQANQTARELVQVDKQLLAAEIRIQISQRELAQHDQQISHAAEIELFLRDKYTNHELYQWQKEQLFRLYKQSYELAFDLAKMAEKAYQFELGKTDTNFIQAGYWDSTHDGLIAGEALQLSLRQMEKSYLDDNRREFELIKHISVVQLNPVALIALRQTGSCELSLPEELFDFDFAGHYFRRIKSISITIPCVAGPFTTVNATLRLLSNRIRINTTDGDNGYEHNQEEGVLIDDARFMENNIPFNAVATSSAQNDSGVFELNFRDERYLPFEGAGAISTWKLELNGKHKVEIDGETKIVDISQFDYDTITDVLLHLRYTAREDAGQFRQKAVQHLQNVIAQANQEMPLARLFSLRQEFPTEWYRFTHPADGQPQTMSFDLRGRFPFFTTNRLIEIHRIELVGDSSLTGIDAVQLGFDPADETDVVDGLSLIPHDLYKGLLRAIPDLDGAKKSPKNVWSLTYLKVIAGKPARILPEELEDILLLVEYTTSGG